MCCRGMLILALFGVDSNSSAQHTTATTTDDATVQQQEQEQEHTQCSSSNTMRSVLVRLWRSAQSRLVKVCTEVQSTSGPAHAFCKSLMICLYCYRRSLSITSVLNLLCFYCNAYAQFAVSEKQLVHVRAAMGVADAKHEATSPPIQSTSTPRSPEFASSSSSNTSQDHFLSRYICIHTVLHVRVC
jgi:hypothetical protein